MAFTPLERKARLVERGRTLASIARDLNVTLSHVSHVNLGHRRSPRTEAVIARALGVSVSEAFPPMPGATAAPGSARGRPSR
jgi:lambda repressor-like predicted transcriptional regulator